MWDAIKVFWWALGPDLQVATMSAVVTIVTAATATWVAIWQIGKQATIAIVTNRENEFLKLKLKIYEEIVPICQEASSAEVHLSSYVRNFGSQVALYRQFQKQGLPPLLPKARTRELIDLSYAQRDRAIRLISLVEKWRIIDPRLEVLQTAINAANHDVDEAFQPYFNFVVKIIPQEIPDSAQADAVYPWQPPCEQQIETLEQLERALMDKLHNLGMFIFDYQTEMQNLLLGRLFNRKLPARKPLDPSVVVLQLGRHDELIAHFQKNTAWGRTIAEAEARVRASTPAK